MSQVPNKVLKNVRSSANLRIEQDQQSQYRTHSQHSRRSKQIEFGNEPYTYGKDFAIYAPTMESIKQLYKSTSCKPNKFIHPQSNLDENDQLPISHLNKLSHVPLSSQSRKSEKEGVFVRRTENKRLTQDNLDKLQSTHKKEDKNILLHKLKSCKTNSTIEILQGLPLKKTTLDVEKTTQLNQTQKTMGKTISYKGLPWVQIDTAQQYRDPFNKKNQIKTQGALRATGRESVEDIMTLSKSIQSNLNELLKQQRDNTFLWTNRLSPVPKQVRGPLVVQHSGGKKLLIADNTAHQRETNVGYSRKANGTFYNH